MNNASVTKQTKFGYPSTLWWKGQCMLKVSSNTLQQVQKFSTWVVFTSEGRQSKEIDRRISKTNTVLHVIYLSVVTKRELSIIAKLSAFKSVFVPILTYGHESWAMAQRALSQVQTTEMEFCEKFTAWHFATKCAAVKILNVQPLFVKPWMYSHFSSEHSGHVTRMLQERLVRWVLQPVPIPTGKRFKGRPRTRWCDYISDLAWTRLVL